MKPAIVYASNKNGLKYLAPAIASLRKAVGDAVDIFVLTSDISKFDLPGVVLIDPKWIFLDLGFGETMKKWDRKWPFETFYRLAIPLIPEFKNHYSVMYIDPDTLVASGKVMDLFRIDACGHEIVAAADRNGTWKRVQRCLDNDLDKDASKQVMECIWGHRQLDNYTYVNAGVLLFFIRNILNYDGERWYRKRMEWLNASLMRGGFQYLDQDFINAMLDVYPVMPGEFNVDMGEKTGEGGVILHFLASTKRLFKDAAKSLGVMKDDNSSINVAKTEDAKITSTSECSRVVAYSTDGNDEHRLMWSVNSVRKFIGDDVKIFVITEAERLRSVKGVTLVNPSKALHEIGVPKRWTFKWPVPVLYKLAIPLMDEFMDFDKVLHLDTDTLVRSSDAANLFRMKSLGFEICGSQDIEKLQRKMPHLLNIVYEVCGKSTYEELKTKIWDERNTLVRGYVNVGVLMEFLDVIRSNGLDWYKKRVRNMMSVLERGRFTYPEQDAVNVFLDVNPSLPVTFNRFAGDYNTNCVVQHFVGGTKSAMPETALRIGAG